MNKKIIYIIAAFFLLWAGIAAAKDDVLVNCKLTPNIPAPEKYPGEENIPSTNNLRRLPGSPLAAKGKWIKIIGRVVDENCVPIANAMVEIWQPNYLGYYKEDARKIDEVYDENFLGSGRYLTNNLGQFEFLSIKPGGRDWTVPKFHLKIIHHDFAEFGTTIYFSDEPKNDFDTAYAAIPYDQRSLVTAKRRLLEDKKSEETTYYIDVALPGQNKYKSYW